MLNIFIILVVIFVVAYIAYIAINYHLVKPSDAQNSYMITVPFFEKKKIGGQFFKPLSHIVINKDNMVEFPETKTGEKYKLREVRFDPNFKETQKIQGRAFSTLLFYVLFGWLIAILNLARSRKVKSSSKEQYSNAFLKLEDKNNNLTWLMLSNVKSKDASILDMYFKFE